MIYILAALFFYTAVILLGTYASRKTDPTLATAITNALSTIIPMIVVFTTMKRDVITNSKTGIIFAVLAGIGVAFFTMALNKAFATNKVAIVSPIVFGGAIFLSAFFSFFIFKEKITPVQGIGLDFLGIGLLIIIYAKMTDR